MFHFSTYCFIQHSTMIEATKCLNDQVQAHKPEKDLSLPYLYARIIKLINGHLHFVSVRGIAGIPAYRRINAPLGVESCADYALCGTRSFHGITLGRLKEVSYQTPIRFRMSNGPKALQA
jgi:hypothetical protein